MVAVVRGRLKSGAAQLVRQRIGYDAETGRLDTENRWLVDALQYEGKSVQRHRRDRTKIRALEPGSERELYLANMIKRNCSLVVSKLEGANLEFSVAPNTADRRDRLAAEGALALWRSIRDTSGFKAALNQAIRWGVAVGTGITKQTWVADAGTPKRTYLEPESGAQLDAATLSHSTRLQLEAQGSYKDEPQGNVQFDLATPWEVHVDPLVRQYDWNRARWVAHERMMAIEEAAEHFSVPESRIERANDMMGAERFLALLDGESTLITGQTEIIGPRCRVVEYYEKPTAKNMRGRKITMVGGHVVSDEHNPLVAFGSWQPFAFFHWGNSIGRFWGRGLVYELRSAQDLYNRSRQHMLNIQSQHGHPTMVIPKGSGVAPIQLPNYAGNAIEYNPMVGKPEFAQPPRVPEAVIHNTSLARQELDDLSAQGALEGSKLPGQLRSGQAVAMMQASNNTTLAGPMGWLALGLQEAGRQTLRMLGHLMPEDQAVRVSGVSNFYQVRQLNGADLRGNYRLEVRVGDDALQSPAEFKSWIMECVQLGILNPAVADDRAMIFDAMLSRSAYPILGGKRQHQLRQQAEIDFMIEHPDKPAQISEWEDHAQHALVLEEYLNGQEYPSLDAEAQARIQEHYQMHSQMLQQQMEAQMQLQAQIAAGGQQGTPSPPARR